MPCWLLIDRSRRQVSNVCPRVDIYVHRSITSKTPLVPTEAVCSTSPNRPFDRHCLSRDIHTRPTPSEFDLRCIVSDRTQLVVVTLKRNSLDPCYGRVFHLAIQLPAYPDCRTIWRRRQSRQEDTHRGGWSTRGGTDALRWPTTRGQMATAVFFGSLSSTFQNGWHGSMEG